MTPPARPSRLVGALQAKRQHEGEDTLEQRLAIAQQLKVRGFVSKIDGTGAIVSCLFGGFPHEASPGSQVVRTHEGQGGEVLEIEFIPIKSSVAECEAHPDMMEGVAARPLCLHTRPQKMAQGTAIAPQAHW